MMWECEPRFWRGVCDATGGAYPLAFLRCSVEFVSAVVWPLHQVGTVAAGEGGGRQRTSGGETARELLHFVRWGDNIPQLFVDVPD